MSSEARNPRTTTLDLMSSAEAVSAVVAEDQRAVSAVLAHAEDIGRAVDAACRQVTLGGRITYFGAGASGRIAMLDATELGPTFGVPPTMVTACFAGGPEALVDPARDLEDREDLGWSDAAHLTASDVALGVTASGRTPYVKGALGRARTVGATTILLTCTAEPVLTADYVVALPTGPEALTGSTRLKAGTATKSALNAFSTVLMVRLGRTYSNLMTGVTVTNAKLEQRARRITQEVTGVDEAAARGALEAASWRVDVAIVSLLAGCGPDEAAGTLAETRSVRAALDRLGVTP